VARMCVGFLEAPIALSHGEFGREQDVLLVPDGLTNTKGGGRLLLNARGAAAAISAFERHGVDIPFDVNHSTVKKALQGDEAPAFGWGSRLFYEPGRGLMCHVKWTEEGYEAISQGRYRYLSPVVGYVPQTHLVQEIHSAALCTKPATPNMPALAASDVSLLFAEENSIMDGLVRKMLEEGEGSVVTAEQKMGELRALLEKLGVKLGDSVDFVGILNAAMSLLQGKEPGGDDKGVSPATASATDVEKHAAVLAVSLQQSGELAGLKAREAERTANDRIEHYLNMGVLLANSIPQMEAARYLALTDPQRFEAIMSSAAPIVPQGRTVAPSGKSHRRFGIIQEARRRSQDDSFSRKTTSELAFVNLALQDADMQALADEEARDLSIAKPVH
jgi:phage I-like protein